MRVLSLMAIALCLLGMVYAYRHHGRGHQGDRKNLTTAELLPRTSGWHRIFDPVKSANSHRQAKHGDGGDTKEKHKRPRFPTMHESSSEHDEEASSEQMPPFIEKQRSNKKNNTADVSTGTNHSLLPMPILPFPSFSLNFGGGSSGFIYSLFNVKLKLHGWLGGQNVCKRIVKETSTADSSLMLARVALHHSFDCKETGFSYQCKTEAVKDGMVQIKTEIHECCPGYMRVDSSCVGAKDIVDVKATATKLGASEFAEAFEALIAQPPQIGRNYTVFAASNSAFHPFMMDLKMDTTVVRVGPTERRLAARTRELFLAHAIDRVIYLSDFENEQLIPTMHPSAEIRMNVYDYPNAMVTANCKPLTSANHLATNGVVHLVDGVLTPVTDNILSKLKQDSRLDMFVALLEKVFDEDKLALQSAGHLTIFAPTNEALKDSNVYNKLISVSNSSCLIRILRRHILPNVFCMSAIKGTTVTRNVDGGSIVLQRKANDTVIVGSRAKIVDPDQMVTNGVIHIIDTLLLQPEDMNFEEIMSAENLTDFLRLMNAANIDPNRITNVTLLVPTNDAMENISKQMGNSVDFSKHDLAALVNYHILPGLITFDKFPSHSHTTLGVPVRLQSYAPLPFVSAVHTANCVKIVKMNIHSCGGLIHEVEEVLRPPTQTTAQIIGSRPDMQKFYKLLQQTTFHRKLTANMKDLYTVYAPNDEAMNRVSNHAKLSQGAIEEFVSRHIVSGYKCCAGVSFARFDTEAGSPIWLTRNKSTGSVSVNNGQGKVVECDIVGTNGVVHAIDKAITHQPLLGPISPISLLDFGIF